MQKDIAEIVYTEQQLRDRVGELAAEIARDYHGRSPLLVSILKGSFIFMADLTRELGRLELPCSVDFMVVSSYGSGTKTTGAVKIIKDLDTDIHGRDIILVEDILDSGLTLSYLREFLLESKKPASLRICTLLDKPDRRTAEVVPDYKGFTIPDKFIVGYGLDYAESYRNLPYIGVLKPEIYSE